ncbi:MAG: dihydropyrimidinase [Acidimicrobiales bacterium]|nr:dihydropyrimidinase [Acidimicrobiales bacterium]MDG2217867.1 dihydropyrimidinase [Acidimicrobiales bacterium]
MSQFDLVIQNGTVVTATDTIRCDVGVKDGRISSLAERLTDAHEFVDADGMFVLPGGVDAHVHLDEPPFYGVLLNDSYETGTRAAAHGGTTTIISFAQQQKGRPLRESLDDYHAKADGNAVVDYGFHIILTDPSEQVANEEIPALIEDGYTSYKCFMTYDGYLDDGQILRTMEVAKREGAMVMIHAENEHCIRHMAKRFDDAGETSLGSFSKMAPMCVEREGTHRAISMSELIDVPILIVHVSGREAMDQIRWGQDRGLKIYGETCPQYLMFTDEVYDKEGWEGAKFLFAPPPRDAENPDALWRGIATGMFQVISSDHNAFQFDSTSGKKAGGSEPHFRQVAPGIPGIEARLALVFSEGVSRGRIDINTFVATTATNPAKIYGLYPRKGTIAVGADADIAIWDPEKRQTITHDLLHEEVDFTPYEGVEIKGWPIKVYSRGELIVSDGEFVGESGRGEFLRRNRINVQPAQGQPVRGN